MICRFCTHPVERHAQGDEWVWCDTCSEFCTLPGDIDDDSWKETA